MILLKRGQKHNDTLNVFIVNSTNGSYFTMLYSIANMNKELLEYILHANYEGLLELIMRPHRLKMLASRKHMEQNIVDAGPSCFIGNSSWLSCSRMIVIRVMLS